jgi:hypothetical protein
MSKLTLTDEEEDVSIEVELRTIAERLGDEYILSDDDESDFAYLSAIALETKDSNYTIQDTLMEFIRNTSALDNVDADDCDEIEGLLY